MTRLSKIQIYWSKGWQCMPAITAFVITLHPRLSAFSLILWGIMAVVGGIVGQQQDKRNATHSFIWSSLGPVLYFFGLALGMFWTKQMGVGWFALEVKSTLVILPVLFWLQVRWSSNSDWINWTVRAFLWGLGIFMVWRFLLAGWLGDSALWRYDGLAGPFHPTYIAAYLTLGMFLMPHKSRWRKPFVVMAALFIGLLASKAGWLVAFALLGFMLVLFKVRTARWDVAAGVAAIALVLGGGLGDQGRMQEFMGYAMHRTALSQDEVTSDEESAAGQYEGEAMVVNKPKKVGSSGGRMQAWRASWILLKAHPFGVGTGDVVDELVRIYVLQNSDYALKIQMNPHSTYWQALVTLGWLGGVLLMLWFGGLFWDACKGNALNLGVFAAIVLIHGVFESILELQQGVVVWVFLGLLLSHQGKERLSQRPGDIDG